jgi:glycosyltransferase involved in cell wall biosynthesis
MPVYNDAVHINEAIDSILNQTFKQFELLIIDDGSTDSTLNIISKYSDERIKLFIRSHAGLISQLNFGLSVSNGDLIARMDSDDIAMPEKLTKQFEYLSANFDIDIVGTGFYFINEKGANLLLKKYPEHHEDIEFMMPMIDCLLHSTMLARKKSLIEVGGYYEGYLHAEDDELFLRLLVNNNKFHNLQEPLYKYRISGRNSEYYNKHKENSYKCSLIYLNNFYKNKNFGKDKGYFYFRRALLEYYKGSISNARKYLLKSFFYIPDKFFKILRYLIFTFLGHDILNNLRRKNVTQAINHFLINKLNIDTYNIKK